MNDKICLITGATSGIGKETAIGLAQLGATIVIAARDDRKGESTKKEIINLTNNKRFYILHCDLSSFASIHDCCEKFNENFKELHVLINNAGIWEKRRKNSKDGIELTFAVNHLAPFLMTNLLLEKIKKSSPSRIITVSSGLHQGVIFFDDIERKKSYSSMIAYRQSKLANILFTKELANRLKNDKVTANCLLPGFNRTDLFRNASLLTRTIIRLIASNPRRGARTVIYLASSPELENISGECFSKMRVTTTSRESNDAEMAKKLWDLSTQYVGKWLSGSVHEI